VGLIYFFSSSCRFCQLQSPLIEKLYRDYEIPIRGVSVDGGTVPYDFPQHYNPQLALTYGIRSVPAVVAKTEEGVKLYFLSQGFTPMDALKDSLLRILVAEGIVEPWELNPNYYGGEGR